MRVLCLVTTSADNLPLLEECLVSLNRNIDPLKELHEFKIVVCDFGKEDAVKEYVENNYNGICLYIKNLGASMPENVNVGLRLCLDMDYDVFVYLNDDISLHEKFIESALEYLQAEPNVGFVGGSSQIGGWNENLERKKVPEPSGIISIIYNITRLNWEAALACQKVHPPCLMVAYPFFLILNR